MLYLACAPKSNAAYVGYSEPRTDVEKHSTLEVPMHLRNAPTRLMKDLGYGAGYRYANDELDAYAAAERYLPDELAERGYYQPVDRGLELRLREALERLRGKPEGMMPLWVWVALRSALGGVWRYAIAKIWPTVPGGWPVATIAANVLGSFAIGVLSVLLAIRGMAGEVASSAGAVRVFWMTGVLGGFTTYSAFAFETVNLASGKAPWPAAVYVVATLVLCLAAAWAGRALVAS